MGEKGMTLFSLGSQSDRRFEALIAEPERAVFLRTERWHLEQLDQGVKKKENEDKGQSDTSRAPPPPSPQCGAYLKASRFE